MKTKQNKKAESIGKKWTEGLNKKVKTIFYE